MFKIIIKSIGKQITATFIIVSQIVLFTSFFYDYIEVFGSQFSVESECKSILGDSFNKTLKIEFNDRFFSDEFSNQFTSFDKQARENKNITFIGGFDITNDEVAEFQEITGITEMMTENRKGTFKEMYPSVCEILKVTDGIENFKEIKLVEDSNVNNMFSIKTGEQVCYLGYSYKDFFKVGETITLRGDNKTFRIKGFLVENTYWFDDGSYVGNKQIELDDKIIVPFDNKELAEKANIMTIAQNYFVVCNDEKKIADTKNYLNAVAKELKINISINTVQEDIDSYISEYEDIFQSGLILMTFLVLMVGFTITASVFSLIEKRKKELGIRISQGASNKYIKYIFVLQFQILGILANIIGIFLMLINNNWKITRLDIKLAMILLISTIIYIFIVSLIPLNKIKKIEPRELIGGNE